ncbi:SseB family protein [Leifsonia poae]|uniref:SseB protein N-terminal domain-containing protein n=1 Tax=Leifsonia poae TaxID=110933 RepID=A0A9W6LXV4_9MICO|nr:SseB family protein [Leifsonia poae]GLJ74548.1 hypothetical protein GCM10017584_01210 [Leifsonia poae]
MDDMLGQEQPTATDDGGDVGLFSRGKKTVQPPAPPAEQKLVRNEPLQAALQAWSTAKDARRFAGVLRQCATGELLLDGTGSTLADPARGFQQGDTLAIGYRTDEHGRRLLLAFTSNERLADYHEGAAVLSFAQPAASTLAQAAEEPYDGIAIDPGSDGLCIAYADEIRRHLTDEPALNEELKAALVTRTLPWDDLLDVIGRTRTVFIATQEARDESGAITGISVPTVDGKNGETYAIAFTSPAEVWAWAPPFDAHPTGFSNIARAALEDGTDGVVLNPAGQSVLIAPDELARFAR